MDLVVLWLLSGSAWGSEVDSWAPYHRDLPDSTDPANRAFDVLLDRAAHEVGCTEDQESARQQLATAIRRATAKRTRVRNRPLLRGLGYGTYTAWMEVDPSIAQIRTRSEGIFAEVSLLDSPVLRLAGTSSSVRLNGIPIGTDKLDHFLATGFSYAKWSRWGEKPDRAQRRGTRTERRFLGRLTSKAFSYADLEANWSGYRFYLGLLGEDSVLRLDDQGCVVRVMPFDWSAWVEPGWDEFQNPSAYGPRVRSAIREAVEPDRDALCAAWLALPPEEFLQPTAGRVPEQHGPLDLGDLCPQAL